MAKFRLEMFSCLKKDVGSEYVDSLETIAVSQVSHYAGKQQDYRYQTNQKDSREMDFETTVFVIRHLFFIRPGSRRR